MATRRGVGKTAVIKGTTLRRLLAGQDVTQKELASKIGITHFRVSSLAKLDSINRVKLSTAEKIAKTLKVPLEFLAGDESAPPNLSEDQAMIIDMYSKLDPIQKAEAMLKMKSMLDESNQ